MGEMGGGGGRASNYWSSVCVILTLFGFLQQCIKYTKSKSCTAVLIERLRLAVVAINGGGGTQGAVSHKLLNTCLL